MLPSLTYLDTDLGRDLFEISNIFLGHMVWLGPRLSLGFHISPVYYYQYLPLFYLTGGNPASLWWTQTLLSLLVLYFFYRQTKSKLSVLFLATTSIWLTISFHPGNGYIYALWLALAIIIRSEFALGLSLACHPLGILGLPFFFTTKLKKILKLLFFLTLPWLPIIAFEIITKGYLIRSILSSGIHTGSSSSPHYYFGIKIIIFIIVITFINKLKIKKLLLFIWLFFNLLALPKYFTAAPTRTIYSVGDTVQKIISQNIIDKNQSLNIISILGAENKVPAGDDYRFFFQMAGYRLKDTFSYSSSDQLLIINEVPGLDWQTLGGWEFSQFTSQKYVIKSESQIGNTKVVLLWTRWDSNPQPLP